MGMMRSALLWVSRSPSLRRTLPRYAFIRRAVKRFMPGEEMEDALGAAGRLREQGFPTIFTYLGENVGTEDEAQQVVDQYSLLLEKIRDRGLDCHLSVKLTQLGLDLGSEICLRNLSTIVRRAEEFRNFVWIDMEGTAYADRTLDVFRAIHEHHTNAGVCLQSYLLRTENDLTSLRSLSPMIRLVKGAYSEPPELAFRDKKDVDENFLRASRTLLDIGSHDGILQGIGTHDRTLIRQITEMANEMNLPKDRYEFQMLYGIQTQEQERLRSEGYCVRVLISYGTYWFPWYMRRLAERPANVLFVLKNIFS
jgi:proline dehydrogenase